MPISAALTAVGAGASYFGAKSAAKTQADAANRATDVQREMYEETRDTYAPFVDTGKSALSTLANLYGLDGGDAYNDEAVAAFEASPDYQFALGEGLKALERSQAGKGLLKSGGTLKRITEYGQGLATQTFGNYTDRLMQLVNAGLSGAGGSSSAALSTGKGIADTTLAAGEAEASGTVAGTNALTSGLQGLSDNLLLSKFMGGGGSSYSTVPAPALLSKFSSGGVPSFAY